MRAMSNLIGRREFVGSVAAGAMLLGCKAPQAVAPAVPATPAQAAAPSAPAAAPVAAAAPTYPPLPPLGDATFARRLDRLRALARDAGASVVFVTSGTTALAYLVGSRVERSERLIALLLPVDGDPVFVAPAFELERLRRQTRVREFRPWEEHESPYAIARDALGARAGAKILVEPHTEYQTALALGRALPGATLVDGTAAFERLRLHKDDEELARIRRAVQVTQDVFDAAFAALRPGLRDRELSAAIAAAFR